MTSDDIKLTDEQWQFVAVLNAIGGSSSIELLGDLVPLKPGPLFDLLKKGKQSRLLKQNKDDYLFLEKTLPAFVQKEINRISNLNFIFQLIETIQAKQLKGQIEPKALIQLLEKLGRTKEAAELEFELVHQAQKQKKY